MIAAQDIVELSAMAAGSMDYAVARLNMVESQIRPNKVTDPRLVAAMLELPREQFLPRHLRGIAYVDEDIPLVGGRAVMEPRVLARLVQALVLKPTDVVLEIGTGCGYGAAVMGRLAGKVVALEGDPLLARGAKGVLASLGLDNVVVVEGPLADGYPSQGPYDAILISGAVDLIPDSIKDQLADGGRLATVLRLHGRLTRAVLATRVKGFVGLRELFEAATAPVPGFELEPGFVF